VVKNLLFAVVFRVIAIARGIHRRARWAGADAFVGVEDAHALLRKREEPLEPLTRDCEGSAHKRCAAFRADPKTGSLRWLALRSADHQSAALAAEYARVDPDRVHVQDHPKPEQVLDLERRARGNPVHNRVGVAARHRQNPMIAPFVENIDRAA
jgi:hypothetical protein